MNQSILGLITAVRDSFRARTIGRSTLTGPGAAGRHVVARIDRKAAPSYRLHSSRSAGADSGAPVFVLVHGLGMSHRYFSRLQRELSASGDTHVLDLPGFGGTPKPGHPLSVQDYADVLARALDAAQLTSCTLIGHSMGAQFVTELALRRPDLVARVILIGPVTDPGRASALSHTLFLGLDTVLEHPLTTALVAGAYARCGLPWYFTELPVMLKYRLDQRLPLVPRPVLVIRGTLDPIARRDWCVRLAGTARKGRLVEVPGQAHAAHRTGAAAVGAAIVQFAEEYRLSPTRNPGPSRSFDALPAVLKGSAVQYATLSEPPTGTTSEQRASLTAGDRQSLAHLIPHRTESIPDAVPGAQVRAVPVFVLIHGIGMSHRYFKRLGDKLSAHGRVILLDLPGSGLTPRPSAGMTNAAKAEFVGALLDEMGVSSCVVIGHSMGVQSATELALQRPGLVSQLVLIGSAVDARRRTVPQQALALAVNNALEKPSLNAVQFTDVLRCGPRWYLAELRVAMNYPLEERVPLVGQPVLLMRGSRDLVARSHWSRRLAESAADGELAEVDGAFHGVHHSAAGAVADRIMVFLASTSDRLDEPEAA